MKLTKHRKSLLTGVVLAVFGLVWLMYPAAELTEYPAVIRICDRGGTPLRTVYSRDETYCVPLDSGESGDWIEQALVAAEDKRFYRHIGIDPVAIARAAVLDVACLRIVSGASTISTQVIKLNNPRRRSFAAKLAEAAGAIKMERALTKDEILMQYINRIPVGGNLVGVQAAGRRYFGKNAADLTLGEAALIAGLPQAPSRFRPDRHLKRALKRRKFVLDRMEHLGFITHEQRATAEEQPMEVNPHYDAFRAPHFCELVLSRRPSGIKGGRILSTLDSHLQRIAEDVMRQAGDKLRGKGVFGGAVVVIDVKSGGVAALVGSPDYDDLRHAGRVNCAVMPRSPGSALKPFAYALAVDSGLYTPGSLLEDAPLYFKDYTPRNFDHKYRGKVTLRRALVDSLNIPALTVVNREGLERFIAELRELGLQTVSRGADDYGLSIVLGTCEVSLLELVNSYACLARLGVYKPYRLLLADRTDAGRRIFSEAASWMIADMLGGNERDMAVFGHTGEARLPRIAWKTGTSSGGRDAWTVGYNPEYAVGVWLGNPSGGAAGEITGIGDAAPIMMDIFRRIYSDGESPFFERPAAVGMRTICAESGLPAGRDCRVTTDDFYIAGVSEPGFCRQCGRHLDRAQSAARVRILRPRNGEHFVLSDDIPLDRQRLALAASGAGKLCWFVDGEWLGESSGRMSWRISRGRHEIVCTAASGATADRVTVFIE